MTKQEEEKLDHLKADDGSNPIFPEEHYAALGKFAVSWSTLEFSYDTAIWELMGVSQVIGASLTAQMMSLHPRFKALVSLAYLRAIPQKTIDELSTFNGNCSALINKRNRTIHDMRMLNITRNQVARFQITTKKHLQFAPMPESVSELEKLRHDVLVKIHGFYEIKDKLIAQASPLDDKLTEQYPRIIERMVLGVLPSENG